MLIIKKEQLLSQQWHATFVIELHRHNTRNDFIWRVRFIERKSTEWTHYIHFQNEPDTSQVESLKILFHSNKSKLHQEPSRHTYFHLSELI